MKILLSDAKQTVKETKKNEDREEIEYRYFMYKT